MSASGATLTATFEGVRTNPAPQEAGFRIGTSQNALSTTVYTQDLLNAASGSFTASVSSLASSTTYYYQAFMMVHDGSSSYKEITSSVNSFTTSAGAAAPPSGWLELPAVTGNEDFVGKFYGSGSKAGTNRNYSYAYDYEYYASMWVAYPLCTSHQSGSGGSSWSYNPDISEAHQVSIVKNSYQTVYGNGNYARGHQCPNASRKSNAQMNKQTYYATNQTPQLQNQFNGSIWGRLEGAVRGLTTSASDTVYVVTGPLYRKVGGNETINYLHGANNQNANPQDLPIPNYYWKAILKVKRNSNGEITDALAIGFWFDHRNYSSNEEYSDPEHIVSVDKIEEWTGLDLFTNLPGTNESGLEMTAEKNTTWNSNTFRNF